MSYVQRTGVPKNGHRAKVGTVARISGSQSQKELSRDDQIDHARDVAGEIYGEAVDLHVIASTTGKGEDLTRPELAAIECALRDPTFDMLILEDLGRLIRGSPAVRLLGIGVDNNIRTICLNEDIDTADEQWEARATSASADHLAHNSHTSQRLKHKLTNRFLKEGLTGARPIAGYIVPPGIKSFYGWQRDDAWCDVIVEGKRRLEQSLNCSMVADYFNEVGFPVSRCVRKRKTWDGNLVREYYANRLLGGYPGRGFRITRKRYSDGVRRSVKNPLGPKFIHVPHLAHIPIEELDDLNVKLSLVNKGRGRPKQDAADRRSDRTWKRTPYPGGACRCWYCGHLMVWGGNGMRDMLMCSGVRKYCCWFSVSMNGPRLARAVTSAIWQFLDELVATQPVLEQLLADTRKGDDIDRREESLRREESEYKLKCERFRKNLLFADLSENDPLILETRKQLHTEDADLKRRRRELERLKQQREKPLQSIHQLRTLYENATKDLAVDSPDMGVVLRKIVKDAYVYGVRCITGGGIEPRVKLTLAFDGMLPDGSAVPGVPELLTKTLTINLFDPPQHVKSLTDLPGEGPVNCRRLAQRLTTADSKVHATTLQKALKLRNAMMQRGSDDPYEIVTEPPENSGRLRRHCHPRYRFQPRDGYEQPPL